MLNKKHIYPFHCNYSHCGTLFYMLKRLVAAKVEVGMNTSIRRISVRNLKPGMVVANAILSDRNALLVAEKTQLTQPIIDRINESGVAFADILIVFESEYASEFAAEQQTLVKQHAQMTKKIKDSFERIRLTNSLPSDEFVDIAKDISRTMVNTPSILTTLQTVKVMDDYTYTHSVNVGVLAGLIGKWVNYPDVPLLILAGMLHDVGKTKIPLEILNKPTRLSTDELQMMQKHAELGYYLTENDEAYSQAIRQGILYHHERLDGTGYPIGLSGNDIPYFARILAVADMFDAMTSDRVYRNALTPFDVLEEIFKEMFTKLDPGICFVFRQRIKELLVGSSVILSNGANARVVFIDGEDHFKPVLQDDFGRCFSPEMSQLRITEFTY